jgi:chromosome segregation ATPase
MTEEKIKRIEDDIRVESAELLGYEQTIDTLREKLQERENELEDHFQDDSKWTKLTSQIKEYKEKKETLQNKIVKLKEKLKKAKEKFLYHKKNDEV